MKIVVVGSSNMDLIAQVDHLPQPGETVPEAKFIQAFGGKGANQAIAAARLGGEVTFVTTIGKDANGYMMKNQFSKEGLVTDYIIEDRKNPTGIALIFVAADSGQNCIAVAPGANYSLTPDSLPGFAKAIDESDIVVMQAEIPLDTVRATAIRAAEKGRIIMYNPAPAYKVDSELMKIVDILVVNEIEASIVSEIHFNGENLSQIADKILSEGVKNVVITLGCNGVYMKNNTEEIRLPSYNVKAVDTVAAGDTFCGALAVKCGKGDICKESLMFANAASAIAVTRYGAQPSIPTTAEVEEFLNEKSTLN